MTKTRSFVAALAFGAAWLSASPSDAALVSSGWTSIGFGPGSTLNLDVNHDGSTDLSFSSFSSYAGTDYWGNNFYSNQITASAMQLWWSVNSGNSGNGFVVGATPGIGPNLVLDSNSPNLVYGLRETQWRCNGQWWGCIWYQQDYFGYANTGTFYNNQNLGRMLQPFAFDNDGDTNYGWADIDLWMNNDGQYAGNIRRYVFDDSGGRIAAAIPEPETYAMMLVGIGLLGFIARRRNQRTAT